MQHASCMHTHSVHAPGISRPVAVSSMLFTKHAFTRRRAGRPSSRIQALGNQRGSEPSSNRPLPMVVPSIVIPPPSRGSQYLERRGESDSGQGGGAGGGGRSAGGSGGNGSGKSAGGPSAKQPNWGRRLRALILYLIWSCCVYFLLNSFVAVCHGIVKIITSAFTRQDSGSTWGGSRSATPSLAVSSTSHDMLNTDVSLGPYDSGVTLASTEEVHLSGPSETASPTPAASGLSESSTPSAAAAAVASIGAVSAHGGLAVDHASKGSPMSQILRSIRQSSVTAPPFSATSPPTQPPASTFTPATSTTSSSVPSPSTIATASAASVSNPSGVQPSNVSSPASSTQGIPQSRGPVLESRPEEVTELEHGRRGEQGGTFGGASPSFGVTALVQDGVEGAVPKGPAVMYPTLSLYVMILGGVALFRSVM